MSCTSAPKQLVVDSVDVLGPSNSSFVGARSNDSGDPIGYADGNNPVSNMCGGHSSTCAMEQLSALDVCDRFAVACLMHACMWSVTIAQASTLEAELNEILGDNVDSEVRMARLRCGCLCCTDARTCYCDARIHLPHI